MGLLGKIIANCLAVVAAAYLLQGIHLAEGFWTIVFVAVVIGFLNAVVRPILIILTIPATILTLGLFILVINAAVIMLADRLLDGLAVDNFWWALAFSLLLSLFNSILKKFDPDEEKKSKH